MFENQLSGAVTQLLPNDQTLFQCILELSAPTESISLIQPGTLIAAENLLSAPRKQRYTILQVVRCFPAETQQKKNKGALALSCAATPLGLELSDPGARKAPLIQAADTFTIPGAAAFVLDDATTMSVIHQIAPESRTQENGSRIDVGAYAACPAVKVGLDTSTLVRGNIAIISARPRARTTMAANLLSALLANPSYPLHVVYCDVNNQGSMSLLPQLATNENAMVLCLNDKFVPSSVFQAMKNPGDRSLHKRATLDYLDMMILPSVLEPRRHDFSYGVSSLFRANKVAFYRPNEQTVDQFVNDIRIDILDGAEADVEPYLTGVINGIVETYAGERFGEKNTRDILEMIDEFSQESKSHAARRTLYDLRTEIQGAWETYSKDIPAAHRKTINDMVASLNDESRSTLLAVQGHKTTDIMRFIGALSQALIDERLKRLKTRVPVLFIFNNADEYVTRNGGSYRESGSDRFQDLIQLLVANGRRHGLGFCLTLESARSLDKPLARRIGSYFIGPITFTDEPPLLAQLLNVSEELLRPAVNYEDGRFLFASSDSPYHRRVPIPISTLTNTAHIHAYLDELAAEAEKRRKEYQAMDEERQRRFQQEREDRRKRQEEESARSAAEPGAGATKEDAPPPASAASQASGRDVQNRHGQTKQRDRESGRKAGDTRGGKTVQRPNERTSRDRNDANVRQDEAAKAILFAETPTVEKSEPSGAVQAGDAPPDADLAAVSPKNVPSVKPIQAKKRGRRANPKQEKQASESKEAESLTIQTSRYGGYEIEAPQPDELPPAPAETTADGTVKSPAAAATDSEAKPAKKKTSRGRRGGRRAGNKK